VQFVGDQRCAARGIDHRSGDFAVERIARRQQGRHLVGDVAAGQAGAVAGAVAQTGLQRLGRGLQVGDRAAPRTQQGAVLRAQDGAAAGRQDQAALAGEDALEGGGLGVAEGGLAMLGPEFPDAAAQRLLDRLVGIGEGPAQPGGGQAADGGLAGGTVADQGEAWQHGPI